MPKMNAAQISAFLQEQFPQAGQHRTTIEELRDGHIRVRRQTDERNLRPGDTISGPTLMALADTTMYCLVLSMIGPVALALTTNLNINFMRAPKPGDILAEGDMLKLGRRLAVGSITMFSDGSDKPVAHATVTYSVPPDRDA